VAANRALQRAQAEPGDGIRLAAVEDEGLQAGWSVNGGGAFSAVRPAGSALAFLRELLALRADPGAYMAGVLELLLHQEGVAAAALYRREFGDSHRLAAGAIAGSGGARPATGERLPRGVREAAAPGAESAMEHCLPGGGGALVFPLVAGQEWLGYLALGYRRGVPQRERFSPDALAMRHLANVLATLPLWRMAAGAQRPGPPLAEVVEPPAPGYVEDNMEGAIDQAVFLAGVDMPVAVIGPRGTGKLYVARVIHRESGAAPDRMSVIDCRELRGRREAQQRIARELERSRGRTLVFKSPQLLPAEVQQKLARQVSSRVLADASPPRALAQVRFVALFPDRLSHLERFGGLEPALASAFAGFPIEVPPLKERRRAILRWAHKILAQEAASRDRRLRGFTPDAEEAMLRHDWPGNISEMRQLIVQALDRSAKEWITPVDLGLFRGLKADGAPQTPEQQAYLASQLQPVAEEPAYLPTTLDELGVALGEALHTLLEQDALRPLGAWLDDELVLAACERYRGDTAAAARFLRTRSRNVQRWLPKILARDPERSASLLWQAPRRLVQAWVREAPLPAESPQDSLQAMLLAQVVRQCGERKVAERALIMGVSIPTFQKRLQELAATDSGEQTP